MARCLARTRSHTQWGDPLPLSLTIFGLANMVAAALAVGPGRRLFARVAGTLTLVPAYFLIRESDSVSDDARWWLVGFAAALVIAGGLWGGGILMMIARKAVR